MKYYLQAVIFLVMVWISGCEQKTSPTLSQAQEIIDKAIETHGGDRYLNASVAFTFRGKEYTSLRQNGKYVYTRAFDDSLGRVSDRLTNEGFTRKISGKEIAVADTMAQKYTNSINSVIYFALLPYGLNDQAVKKKYMGQYRIESADYHKIEVTFTEEGGGEDFDDVFVYWIHPENFTVDFLAYEFHVDGGGVRFRKAFNTRTEGGIRFADYVNYKADPAAWKVQELDRAYAEGALKELSKIELESLKAETVIIP